MISHYLNEGARCMGQAEGHQALGEHTEAQTLYGRAQCLFALHIIETLKDREADGQVRDFTDTINRHLAGAKQHP